MPGRLRSGLSIGGRWERRLRILSRIGGGGVAHVSRVRIGRGRRMLRRPAYAYLGNRSSVHLHGVSWEYVVDEQLKKKCLPPGKRPVPPFAKCFPRYHPSPNPSSSSTSSILSPRRRVNSSSPRASKSSNRSLVRGSSHWMPVGNPRAGKERGKQRALRIIYIRRPRSNRDNEL